MYRVLVADKIAPAGLALLERTDGIEAELGDEIASDALRDRLATVDGVIIRSGTMLSADVLAGQDRLKVIVRAGVGVDNIDVAAATREGIVVMNTPAGNTTSTAEHTVAMLLALSRNIVPASASLRDGEWQRSRFVGTQLAGKTLGIIGLGRVGLAVAERAAGLSMRVIGYDPFLSADRAADAGIELFDDLDRLVADCDFLTVHTPLTAETRGMIDAARIGCMKPGVRIINCARGGIIDEQALFDGLEAGHVGGAAIDVFSVEPPGDHPLLALPNVLATPHLGASTEEAQEQISTEAAEILVGFLLHGELRHAVNMAPIAPAELEGLNRYLDLGYRLGRLLAQQTRSGRLVAARLDYRGDVAERATRLVTASFTAGVLETALDESVNLVNAGLVAAERGIRLTETTSSQAGDFSTLVAATLETDSAELSASATVFGNEFLRLVRLGPFQLDAYLDGLLLIFHHRDVPGLIGFIGSVLGREGVNIAHMALGRERDEPGGQAVAVLNLDTPPSAAALAEVAEHAEVTGVELVELPVAGSPLPWLASS